jgi:hypothetical protein
MKIVDSILRPLGLDKQSREDREKCEALRKFSEERRKK